MYNSCGCSQCPTCGGTKRFAWQESTSALLLDDIKYFQVVFTMPDALSSLALGNRKRMCNLLFQSAWAALRQTIEDEQRFEAAAAMVLHTWNQRLEPHMHVHALVPGGGPALDGSPRWVTSRRRKGPKLPGDYLVDAVTLRVAFRDLFLKGLEKLHRKGKLKLKRDWSHLQSEAAFDDYLQPMRTKDWVTYIEPPPKTKAGEPVSSPEHVVKYLARYMTGGPISARRLVSYKNDKVTFLARKGDKTGGSDETEPVTLNGTEFVRRWSMHILPSGFVKTRRYGGYSNHHAKRYLAECRELLSPASQPEDSASPINSEPAADDPNHYIATEAESAGDLPVDPLAPICPNCKQPMVCVAAMDRPSWKVVMSGPSRPHWYRRPGGG